MFFARAPSKICEPLCSSKKGAHLMLPDILHSGALDGLDNYRVFRRRYPQRTSLPTRAISDWHLQEVPLSEKPGGAWICLVGVYGNALIRTSPITSIVSSRKVCTSNCIYVLGPSTKGLEHPVRGLERLFAEGFPHNWEELVEKAFAGTGLPSQSGGELGPGHRFTANYQNVPIVQEEGDVFSEYSGSKLAHAPSESIPGFGQHGLDVLLNDFQHGSASPLHGSPVGRESLPGCLALEQVASTPIRATPLQHGPGANCIGTVLNAGTEHEDPELRADLGCNGDVNDDINALLNLIAARNSPGAAKDFAGCSKLPLQETEMACIAKNSHPKRSYPTVEEAIRNGPFKSPMARKASPSKLAIGQPISDEIAAHAQPKLGSPFSGQRVDVGNTSVCLAVDGGLLASSSAENSATGTPFDDRFDFVRTFFAENPANGSPAGSPCMAPGVKVAFASLEGSGSGARHSTDSAHACTGDQSDCVGSHKRDGASPPNPSSSGRGSVALAPAGSLRKKPVIRISSSRKSFPGTVLKQEVHAGSFINEMSFCETETVDRKDSVKSGVHQKNDSSYIQHSIDDTKITARESDPPNPAVLTSELDMLAGPIPQPHLPRMGEPYLGRTEPSRVPASSVETVSAQDISRSSSTMGLDRAAKPPVFSDMGSLPVKTVSSLPEEDLDESSEGLGDLDLQASPTAGSNRAKRKRSRLVMPKRSKTLSKKY